MIESVSFWANIDIWGEAMLAALLSAGTLAYLGVWVTLKRVTWVPLAISQVSAVGVMVAFLLHEAFGLHEADSSPMLGWVLEPAWFSLVFTVAFALYFGRPGTGAERPVVISYLIASALILLLGGLVRQDIHDVQSILFGQTVLVDLHQALMVAAGALLVIGVHLILFRRFLFVAFDPTTAGAAGLPVYRTEVALYATLAIMLSVATRAMGALPAFGLTVLPALAGLQVGRRMSSAIFWAVAVGLFSAGFGYYLSFSFDISAGAAMVALAALSLGLLKLLGRYRA